MENQEKSYNNTAFQGAWSARARAMWGSSALGLVIGAACGAVAPFFPVMVGAQDVATATSLIPASSAIFASVGMGSGFVAGSANGTAAGASAAVAQEQDIRAKTMMRAMGIELPTLTEEPAAPDNRSFFQKLKDGYETYVNPRVGLLFAAIGAVGGAVMAAAYIALGGLATNGANAAVPAMTTLLGSAAANPTAVTAYFMCNMAMFGSLWAINVPKVATAFQDYAGQLIGGKLIGRGWEPQTQQSLSTALMENAPPNALPELHQAPAHQHSFTQTHARGGAMSFQERVVKNELAESARLLS